MRHRNKRTGAKRIKTWGMCDMFILNTVHGTNNQAQIYTHTHTHVAMDRGMVWPGSFYCLQTHTQRDIGNFGGYLHNFRNRWIFHRRLNIKFQNCALHLCEYIVFIIRECFFFLCVVPSFWVKIDYFTPF